MGGGVPNGTVTMMMMMMVVMSATAFLPSSQPFYHAMTGTGRRNSMVMKDKSTVTYFQVGDR